MNSIRKSFTTGVFYTAIAKYSNVFFSIFIGAILARLLTPDEFGTVALVTVFVTFFNLLSSFGIAPAIVQNNSLTEKDIQSIFLFTIILGLLLAISFFMLAPLIARFYNKSELVNVAKLLSFSILFNSFQIVPGALYLKALKFKQIGIITVIIQLVAGLISIVLAYKGFSYYALVVNSILSGAISLVVFYWLAPVRISLRMKISSVKKILHFSLFQFLFDLINFFSRNTDNLLIGKYLGSATLGYYDKSYKLMLMPVQNLTNVITPVLMPVLSKHQDDINVVYNAYIKVVKFLATIGFPLSVFLFFCAEEIINIIYGPQWGPSVPVFRILALSIGIQLVLSTTGSIFQVVNRTDLLFYSGALSALLMVGGILYGIFVGKSIESVGLGLLFAFSINFLQAFYMLIHFALGKSYVVFMKTFGFPAFIGVAIGLVLWGLQLVCPDKLIYAFLLKSLVSLLSFAAIYISRKENREFLKHELSIYRNIKESSEMQDT